MKGLNLGRIGLVAGLLVVFGASTSARAATLTVTSALDATVGVAGCGDGCSLREAIASAASGDTIQFALPLPATITLTAGELQLTKSLTIAGPGAAKLTISGGDVSRVIHVVGAGPFDVTIQDVTIAGGRATDADAEGPRGAGILAGDNTGTLRARRTTITGNVVSGTAPVGSAIAFYQGVLELSDSTVRDNRMTAGSLAKGTVAVFDADVLIARSTIAVNTITSPTAATGGGLYVEALTGLTPTSVSVDVTDSTIADNDISGDFAASGGGIAIAPVLVPGNLVRVTITSTTISGNRCRGGLVSEGAGLDAGFLPSAALVVELSNTIVANNNPAGPSIGDVAYAVISHGYNLIGKADGSTGFGSVGDLLGTIAAPLDARLAPLGNYGGPTPTMRPLPGSPALDRGTSAGLSVDQRGLPRPVDLPSLANADDGADIGAVEVQQQPASETITLQIDPVSDPAGAAAELLAAVNTANEDPAPTTIVLKCATYTFSTPDNWEFGPNALPIVMSDVTFEGNGAVLDSTAPTRLRFFYVAGQGIGGLPPGTLTLRNLTLRHGKQRGGDSDSSGGGAGMGGAIFNHGELVLEQVTLHDNEALGGTSGLVVVGAGGGGMGEDAPVVGEGGGGFGGPAIGVGGLGGLTSGPGAVPGGGGGGFRPGDDGSGSPTGNGGGLGLLGGAGGGATASSGKAGDGGGAGGNERNSSQPGSGGDYGVGGHEGGAGGGVGGGGALGDAFQMYGGGGGFGGGGGSGSLAGNGGFGGGGGDGSSGTPVSTFGGGNKRGGGAGLGGAIFNHLGIVTITNSTLTGNRAVGGDSWLDTGSGFGGAIFNLNGHLRITFSTVAGNVVAAGVSTSGGAVGAAAGGIYSLAFGESFLGFSVFASVTMTNSILADTIGGPDLVNDKRDGYTTPQVGSEIDQSIVSLLSGNLVESNVALAGTSIPSPTITSDPLLGSPLEVRNKCVAGTCVPAVLVPSPLSPVINAAGPGLLPATDQAGNPRSQGGGADLGAYEQCCTLAASPIWPVALPNAIANQSYGPASFGVTGVGGTATWSLTGSVPTGLFLSTLTGANSNFGGVPTTPAGPASFAVKVQDSLGCVVQQGFTIAVLNPALSFTKTASAPNFAQAGDVLTYTLTAKNTGNVTVTNVTISDPKIPTLTCTSTGTPATGQPVALGVGKTLTCTGSYTVTGADVVAGLVTNTATASGLFDDAGPVILAGLAQSEALLPVIVNATVTVPGIAPGITAPRVAFTTCNLELQQDWQPRYTKLQFEVWNEDEVKFTGAFECADSWHETDFGPSIDSAAQNFTIGVLGTFGARYRVQAVTSTQCPDARATGLLGVQSMLAGPNAKAIGSTLAGAGKFTGSIRWDPSGAVPEGAIR